MNTRKPKTISSSFFSWFDTVPWWVLVLVGFAMLVILFIVSPADVLATRKAPDTAVKSGETFTYQITLNNNGPAEAVSVQLAEELPAGLTYKSAKPVPKKIDGQKISWDAPDLKPQKPVIYEVSVTAGVSGKASELLPAAQPLPHWSTVSMDILGFLSQGVRVTVLVTLYSFVLAVVLGLFAGLGRVTRPPAGIRMILTTHFALRGLVRIVVGLGLWFLASRAFPVVPGLSVASGIIFAIILYLFPVVFHPYTMATVYVEIFRGVPMLVQVLYLGFVVRPFIKTGLAQVLQHEIEFDEFSAAIIGLGLGYGAYLAEVFRAGIQSIHRGQMEAARSLGMNYGQAMRYIILPQALRRVLPPLANDFVALLKDSSFVSVLSVADLTRQGRLYMSRTYRAFESWNMVAFSYLILTFILSGIARAVERRLSADER
jgi:uncharacterized repeat protein (TIGR01451 family)